MRRIICHSLLFLTAVLSSNCLNGQTRTFDSYTNALLFNVFQDTPDTGIVEFLRLYTPGLLKQQSNGTGTKSAGQEKAEEIHSFVFKHHPFFSGKFAVGKLQFFCTRFTPSNTVEVYDVSLVLAFDDQLTAEQAFSDLIERYLPLSSSKHISSETGSQIALFTNDVTSGLFHTVQIRMCRNYLQKNSYQILLETHQ